MLRFKYPNRAPPGGQYFYVVPETRVTVVSPQSLDDLVGKLRVHYAANRMTPPLGLELLVEDFICRSVADGFCDGDDEGRPRALARNWTFWTVMSRTRAEVAANSGKVGRDVAQARVRVCTGCPMNSRHLCLTCNGIPPLVQAMLGGRSTDADDFVGVCVQTGWLVSAIVHLSIEDRWNPQTEWPEICWIPKGKVP